ncbi:alpha/beta fold hydrolase [Desulfopila aestuarii]|uniref:Alpha/beta hydrolase family protein n=1 Tax=Desulfopila aestuarii DSM 18488 TaxID=1121416 RepID=A0A1M7YF88_9BACT|nr:alpha/beta fold hydrolase [Desulfopila aestuarii]SHO51307.1 Alpha/beta hydrolase family protein [Desulfopila aestuarii DSM 18488]
MSIFFLHGLDSSGQGAKGRYFSEKFPQVLCPDFSGDLKERLHQFATLSANHQNLTLIGSSFGGLMATCFAIAHPERVQQLILLAPALNFGDYTPPQTLLNVPTLLVIGKQDVVTPPNLVLPLARKTFANLKEQLVEDDHMLHHAFYAIPWQELLFDQ